MECGKAAAEIPAAAETAAGSAPDFMIHGVMKYTIGGQELWVTTTTVGLLVITVMLILLAFMAKRTMERASDVPGTFQNILETGVEMLEGMTRARAQLEGPHSKHLPPSGQHCSSVRRKGTGSHWPSHVLSSLAACME